MAKKVSKRRPRKAIITVALLASAASLIAYGALGLWQRHQATHNPRPAVVSGVVTTSTDTPDETPPTQACAEYKVAAAQPKKIGIPSIAVDGCIQQIGIDQHSNIAVPNNIHAAGWYVKSPAPGEVGVSLIDGHVQGRYADAIFGKLNKLTAGDTISITKGDGSTSTFNVVDVVSYPVDQVMSQLFKPLKGVDRQLTLITCGGGSFDKKSQSYDKRVIVRAKAV